LTDEAAKHRAPDAASDNPGAADAAGHTRRRAVRPKHAASLILWREGPNGVEALMGRRHHKLRFMPGVLVFPGGRVDRADHRVRPASPLKPLTRRHLERSATASLAQALAVAALRELHEEAGLTIGSPAAPALATLDYLCRAITPPERPMRFDARFLIAPAGAATGDIRGSGELEEIRFFPLMALGEEKLAPITRLILGEFADWLALSPARRARRHLIRYQGFDRRVIEA
jgi:8-oxo-dGTP pyrophosphatase MutT (NUDIX family)